MIPFYRSFLNVGQALFSVERHGCITTVFDCGGDRFPVVREAIRDALIEGETIDALFLSHYDRDHVNGVRELVKFCKVKRLFLPLVGKPLILYALAEMRAGSFAYEFTLDPARALKSLHDENQEKDLYIPDLHFINEDDGERQRSSEESIPVDINELRNGGNYDSGTDFTFNDYHMHGCWIYRVFNRKYMNQSEWNKFLKNLNLGADATITDILEGFKSNKLGLKKALIEAEVVTDKTINEYSMTLYTGANSHCPEFPDLKNGCLYTGDYNAIANYNCLHNVYADLWDNIGLVQVPHHGSKYNTDNKLIDGALPHAKFVVSSKVGPYNHNGDVDPTFVIGLISGARAKTYLTYEGNVTIPYDCCYHRCHFYPNCCW